jgi:hypothetical protein
MVTLRIDEVEKLLLHINHNLILLEVRSAAVTPLILALLPTKQRNVPPRRKENRKRKRKKPTERNTT